MEDGDANTESNKVIKMGATGNPNAARLATLQERKKVIEESLAKCTQELRQLCIQEADLTGTIPQEMPLEPGESPPSIRRRVGTAYQLPENLVKNSNNKDETIADLELQIQLHANMAEAALGLANEQNISKTLRRQHMSEYQQHKRQFTMLQEKLTFLKDKSQQQPPQQSQSTDSLHKPKKKPRPYDQDDNISLGTNVNEPFVKSDLRHSMRSNKCVSNDNEVEHRYPSYPRMAYKNSNTGYVENFSRHEEALARGLYRMSINGYKSYMERRENMANIHISPSYNTLQYSQHHSSHMQLNQHPQLSPHYQHTQQQSQIFSSQRTSQTIHTYPNLSPSYSQIPQTIKSHHNSPTNLSNSRLHRQSSPNKIFFPPTPPEHNHYKNYPDTEQNYPASNPHQIQPHQQYEHMTLGLGGYWKRSETGETVWCNSNTIDSNWQRDKRFGSLDRRKNKRLQKRISPSVDNKSATLASVPTYSDHVRTASIKSPQVITRRSQDNRQLVRTQSLGSVGAQTIDSVCPSDDNSSCESDNRSINEAGLGVRKQKQKQWLETSLDGPVSPTHSVISRSQSALPSVVLSPEEKYVTTSPSKQIPPPITPKPPLEIPAESNPSPRIPETNIELFNNNIPKNCTIVQAGHCKPYHEETKPFEMSDFYKYSTKFKKSPVKAQQDEAKKVTQPSGSFQKNLVENFENSCIAQSVKNHNFSPMQASPGRMDNSNSLNSSLDLSQISNANVAERFSDEMNAWYKSHKLQIESSSGSISKGKSTATLV